MNNETFLNRFKHAICTAAENGKELYLLTAASLLAGEATVFMIYVVGCLSGLLGW